MDLNRKDLLCKMPNVHQIFETTGSGNFSKTINKNNLGSVSNGVWIGDENALLNGELPQIYSAIAIGEVRAFEVDLDDFNSVIHQDIIKVLTDKAYEKLFKLREKLNNENEKRTKIE